MMTMIMTTTTITTTTLTTTITTKATRCNAGAALEMDYYACLAKRSESLYEERTVNTAASDPWRTFQDFSVAFGRLGAKSLKTSRFTSLSEGISRSTLRLALHRHWSTCSRRNREFGAPEVRVRSNFRSFPRRKASLH